MESRHSLRYPRLLYATMIMLNSFISSPRSDIDSSFSALGPLFSIMLFYQKYEEYFMVKYGLILNPLFIKEFFLSKNYSKISIICYDSIIKKGNLYEDNKA